MLVATAYRREMFAQSMRHDRKACGPIVVCTKLLQLLEPGQVDWAHHRTLALQLRPHIFPRHRIDVGATAAQSRAPLSGGRLSLHLLFAQPFGCRLLVLSPIEITENSGCHVLVLLK